MAMRFLVTIKPEHYEFSHHSYGVLAEIDWEARRVLRRLVLPAASFHAPGGFMAPLIGGLCRVGERVFVAVWNFIVEVDYADFRIVNAVSTPWFADVHGINSDGQRLWLASTAAEAVVGLDLVTLVPVARWGPDAPLLATGESVSRRLARWQRGWELGAAWRRGPDYRFVHKGCSPSYRHHLNEVIPHRGQLYVTTKNWHGEPRGAVMRVDPVSGAAAFHVPPGVLRGMHDGVFLEDGTLLVTESGGNGVAWCGVDGRVRSLALQPEPTFVRGLLRHGGGWLVGFSRRRGQPGETSLVAFNPDFSRELGRMPLTVFHPPEQGSAIHAMVLAPE